MNTHTLNSWSEFEEQIREIGNGKNALYRGQSSSGMKLECTLEREIHVMPSLFEYHHLISVIKPQVEAFTNTIWDILPYPDGIGRFLNNNSDLISLAFGFPEFQNTYSYMAYLRHYGFPSPFLDWTRSPYIAAYFAFKSAREDKYVSVYLSIKPGGDEMVAINATAPHIHWFGPYVRTARRHFLQQSNYSVSIENRKGEWCYASHEAAFNGSNALHKFDIPVTERQNVLELLDKHNINDLSLFGSEEGLMRTMFLRHSGSMRLRVSNS